MQPTSPKQDPPRKFVLALSVLAVFFGLVARSYFFRHPLPFRCEATLYTCLMLLAAMGLAPAFEAGRAWIARRAPAVFATLLVPYFIYAGGCGDLRAPALLRLLAIALPPLLVYAVFPVHNRSVLSWQDALAWTWLTVAVVLRQLHGIWSVPENLDFMARLFVIALASWCWTFLRPVPGIGYGLTLPRRTFASAALAFTSFAAVVLPPALLTGFAAWNPRWRGPGDLLATFVEIFIFIAWLEELFFRGVLQNLLSKTLNARLRARLLASVAFGLSHILLAPAPNWRYVAFASVAGWFYGWAYDRAGNLMAPALAHALVDTVWRTWFGRGA